MKINNNSIEIYFSDLKEEVQREIINTFGKLDDPYKNNEKLLKKGTY